MRRGIDFTSVNAALLAEFGSSLDAGMNTAENHPKLN
jgi:uncharacterized membrane protein